VVFFTAFLVFLPKIWLYCEEETRDIFFIPQLSYEFINVENQRIHIPTTGLGIMKGDMEAPFTEVHNRFLMLAMYQPLLLQEKLFYSFSENYHTIKFLFDGRLERQQFMAILNSRSERPIAGGLQTFTAGIGWGYELLRADSFSFILGAAIAAGDFGIDLPNGDPLPVMPLPLIRLKFKTEWLDGSFDFFDSPGLSFNIAPGRRVRFSANLYMGNYRSVEDLMGEGIIWYRFFPSTLPGEKKSSLGDFLGIGAGIKNESFSYNLSGERNKTFEIQHTSIFGILDVTMLKLSAGYIFDSRELYNDGTKRSIGKGFFLGIQVMYRF
jgi:hypothetical protein